jgi:HTH-type transcriptional regulator, sugar sensing transcriptional regulator
MKEEFLKKLGLSSYEIKIFLTLLQTGQMKARELSRVSGIPYGRIYDVLYSLEKKGLVLVVQSDPKNFEAVKSSIAIERLIEQEKLRLREIEAEKNIMLKEFESSKTIVPPSKEKEKISVYYGSDAALNIGRVGIEKASKEILINTTRLEDPIAQEIITGKLLGGSSVKVMIPVSTEKNYKNIKRIKELGGEVRMGGVEGMKIGIADSFGTLITVTNPKNLKGSITIVVEGKNFGRFIRKFFMTYWEIAKKI